VALTGRSLAFTTVGADDGTAPAKWLYVVHGIFGAGRNWAAVAKRVVRNRPEWGAMLIDLREHGASQGFQGPHTIAAAARDLADLAVATGNPPAAILGHSFGGKVSLEFSRIANDVTQVWVIDSTPEAKAPGGSAQAMLEIVQALPAAFSSRDEAIDALVAQGVARPTAMWMATNLQERGGDYEWRFRLESIAELLESFFDTDEWDVLEKPRDGVEIHLVKASQSSLLAGATLERVQTAADNVHVFLHEVEGGHWLNADNPDAIIELLTEHLPQP
jgi:pimeloyl-ACP methyl ester carboxylesterase